MHLFALPIAACAALLFGLSMVANGAENAAASLRAEDVLKRYLTRSTAAGGYPGEGRTVRLTILRSLSGTSNALETIQAAFPTIPNAVQRTELAESVGRNIQNKQASAVLTEWLKDPDENVRGAALHGLRLMASRINRGGRMGIQAEPAHPPKVEGLVPTLIAAANDSSATLRFSAMYALADTRESAAMNALREHLQDPDQRVRFCAACRLTEIKDASGMAQLKEALHRVRAYEPDQTVQFHLEAEDLLLSFERITGKTFGEIPMNPMLSSDPRKGEELSSQYHALVNTWGAWWDWEPSVTRGTP